MTKGYVTVEQLVIGRVFNKTGEEITLEDDPLEKLGVPYNSFVQVKGYDGSGFAIAVTGLPLIDACNKLVREIAKWIKQADGQ